MTQASTARTIVIPSDPCRWQEDIYLGKEVEFVPVGVGAVTRSDAASHFVRKVAQLIPSRPRFPEFKSDVFTPLGRIYQEMHEFVELAGPTCTSGEAVAWAFEASLEALERVTGSADGRTIILCHTPSDYNDRTSEGRDPAHSTGCHFNMLSPRQLDAEEARAFAALVSPLNAVFGPGGLTWSAEGGPRLSCDPRAGHVARLVGGAAHGTAPKPFLLARHEPYAQPPFERLQCVAFGSPRSPLSSWLQAELLPWALRAVLAREAPAWRVANPIEVLRAAPDAPVSLERTRPGQEKAITKAELAAETILWLAGFVESQADGPEAAHRISRLRELGVEAAIAGASAVAEPPVFPTDIVIKRSLFDRVAQTCGFADLTGVGRRAQAAGFADKSLGKVEEKLILADVLFSSPSGSHSTYELAARSAMFVRPQFEHPIDLSRLAPLPAGVCRRDRARALLLVDPARRRGVYCCDWNRYFTRGGTIVELPDPWSDLDTLVS
jgi:hypothetical protein